MGRSRCLMFMSLLVFVPCLFFSSATAADVGGRRSLLQAQPPTQATPPTPPASPPPRATPPTPPASPPRATPPTPPASPPPTQATPPTVAATPPTVAATPPTVAATPPTTAATPPGQAGALPPAPIVAPVPAPFLAPAPAPIGVTSSQKRNAAIAGGVVGSVIFIAIVLIFCRCNCIRRSKKMPFQRLQMT